ncbi:hypothetical protein [Bordetella petrii]|nr:hypothetical protein [Bordetella petrii]
MKKTVICAVSMSLALAAGGAYAADSVSPSNLKNAGPANGDIAKAEMKKASLAHPDAALANNMPKAYMKKARLANHAPALANHAPALANHAPALAYNMPKAYMKKASLSPDAMPKPEMKKA